MQAEKHYIVSSASGHRLKVHHYGLVEYSDALAQMRDFTNQRAAQEPDQIWLCQHPPVYTQGTSCTQVPLNPSDIPLIKTDRGGQITYHGPGQIVMYPLLNIRRYQLGVRTLVTTLEQSVMTLLSDYGIQALARADAPGVYVDDAKIAALGLRIRRGHSYHGLSLNVDMDLSPFANIDPCGFQGLAVTQLKDLSQSALDIKQVNKDLLGSFLALI